MRVRRTGTSIVYPQNWTRLGHPGTGAIHDIAVDPFNTNVIYANVDDTGIWNQRLYGSIDGGMTWTRIDCRCSVGAQAIAFSRVVPQRLSLVRIAVTFNILPPTEVPGRGSTLRRSLSARTLAT